MKKKSVTRNLLTFTRTGSRPRKARRALGRGEKGLSGLMELVVMAAVCTVFMLFSSIIMLTSFRNWQISHTVTTVHEDTVNALRHMVREVRESSATSPSGINVLAPNASGISFQIPETIDPDTGPTEWETIQYNMGGNDGKQIIRTDENGTRVIATNVADLSFTYDPTDPETGPEVVGISIRGERASASGQLISQTLASEVKVRN